jgi:hypothetical protein
MAIIKPNNNTISAITALPAGVGGKVLQVVQGTATTTMLTTSTTYADTNLTANITPSSTSSKIYVTVNQNVTLDDATDDRVGGALRLLRDSTVIYGGDREYEMFFENNTGNATQNFITVNRNYLDSPSSTSELTYKTQGRIYQSGDQLQFNGGNIEATITLMEIAG